MGFIRTTTPTIATATNTTLLAQNTTRKWLNIQNNSAANIMISFSGATLTGIVPTATNIGFVIVPAGAYSYEQGDENCPQGAITGYQTSGGNINTIAVGEG